MQETLIEALYHAPHKVLGRRLKPLTLRHVFSLSVAGNPFFTGSKHSPDLEDLRQAVEICFRPGDFFERGKRPSLIRRGFWRLRTSRRNLESEMLRFHDYLDDFCSMPQCWKKQDPNSRPLKVNWIFSAVAGLMMDLGMTEDEAWNVSPGKAQWLLVATAERSPWGEVDILGEEDDAAIEELRQMDEEGGPNGGG